LKLNLIEKKKKDLKRKIGKTVWNFCGKILACIFSDGYQIIYTRIKLWLFVCESKPRCLGQPKKVIWPNFSTWNDTQNCLFLYLRIKIKYSGQLVKIKNRNLMWIWNVVFKRMIVKCQEDLRQPWEGLQVWGFGPSRKHFYSTFSSHCYSMVKLMAQQQFLCLTVRVIV